MTRSIAYRCFCAVTVLLVAVPVMSQAPLPESDERTIEYDSVASAAQALAAKDGIEWREENGWAIAVDEAEFAIWSFSPPGYPAYPAVVKRHVRERGQGSTIEMNVLCEASKEDCDALVRTFADMNGLPLPE
ncbi:hypothetical protein [Croceicoccus marinus]|jgi:hypothetical protein|uniref:Molecular chaperone DnaJ n=1 Tax=Croceicoccus marinus TaxID=450378 RepID=A0A7G6VVR6_9SPHN|nr:hypothetical protein [Croceicoccus marinus]QNE05831.1 hypothetical protein H4O24_03945 [Croceicoccus marinus]